MGQKFGNYELVRRIAQGGMAEVHLARFSGVEGFERWVVIKKMLPELAVRKDFVDMFLDEARLAARFSHPNIVQVYELGQHEGTYYMAMEYIDGPHLGALFAHSLRIKKPLPIPLCALVVARAAEGLHHAHELKDANGVPLQIVHRDVSPQNVLVSRQGDVKVMDFGVAKAITQGTVTRTGVVKGKVSYMAPEQCLADHVDRRTDVFALGIVLYELVTRRRLFRDKSDLVVMQKITQEDVPPPSTVNPRLPKELDDIIMQALQRDPAKRTPDALTLSDQLDSFLASSPDPVSRSNLARWVAENAQELTPSAESFSGATPSWSQAAPSRSGPPPGATPLEPTARVQMPVEGSAPLTEDTALGDAPPPEPEEKGTPDPSEGFGNARSSMTPAQQRLAVQAGSVVTAAVVAIVAWALLSRSTGGPEAQPSKPPEVAGTNTPPPVATPTPANPAPV
ncbi:MAG: serine/threonine-protein kinase, partial [Myxococcota bacterium]